MGEISRRDERRSREFFYARWCVNRVYLVLGITLGIPFTTLAIIVASKSFEFSEQSDYDYLIRADPIVQRGLALDAAYENLNSDDASAETRGNRLDFWSMTLYLRAKNGNVITADSLNRQRQVELAVRNFAKYGDFCWFDEGSVDCNDRGCAQPTTILAHPNLFGRLEGDAVCGFNDKDTVTQDEVDTALESWFNDDGSLKSDLSTLLGADMTRDNPQTAYVRSSFPLGGPLSGYDQTDDRFDDQNEIVQEWQKALQDEVERVAGDDFEALLFSRSLYSSLVGDLAFQDFIWIIGSASFVVLYMCIHTRSVYLGLMGMLQIILAFPFTFFFYRLIFRVPLFSNLHLLSVFLILGIGADDVFVFTDAWIQAGGVLGAERPLVNRLAWAYRRASKAMLITSFTTSTAFFVTATNKLLPISSFGIWAGSLIGFQYLLCISIYPCHLIIWERNFRYRRWRQCLRKVEPSEEAEVPIGKEDKLAEREGCTDAFKGVRKIERFYHSTWSPLIGKFRYPLTGLAAVVMGLSIFGATQLQPLLTEEQFVPDSNPAQKPITWDRDFFGLGSESGSVLKVNVVHGISGLDQSDVGGWDTSNVGDVVWDDDFDLTRAENRQKLIEFCDQTRANSDLVLDGDAECWLKDFSAYLDDVLGEPYIDFANQKALFERIVAFLAFVDPRTGALPFLKWSAYLGLSESEERLRFAIMQFTTPHSENIGYTQLFPIHDAWQATMAEANEGLPSGVNKGFATSGPFPFMVTTSDLVSSAVRGLFISLSVSFIAMTISTLNVIISFYAILVVGAIVTSVISMLYLYGFAWGISESIAVVLIVGFSVDYVVHIANAYVESASSGRYSRTREAVTEMGISIVAGAVSTFGSGAFLVGGELVFFDKFGIVMMTTIVASLIWSTIFFVALAMTAGPTGNFGSFLPLLAKLPCWKGSDDAEEVGGKKLPEVDSHGENVIESDAQTTEI